MGLSELDLNIIKLKLIPGIGNRTILTILRNLNEPASKLELDFIKQFLTEKQIESLNSYFKESDQKLENIIESLNKNSINVVNINSADYPDALKSIFNPPAILFYKGDFKYDYFKSIAVVGTRNYSQYGKNLCYKFIKGFAEYNLGVISGLALGIDAISHKIALEHNLKCIGVVGHGLEHIYPASNYDLYNKILEKNGCIISELLPNEEPIPANFPQRNRIIAGLARATLVIEAAEKSGSLITAQNAFDENRDVYAIPADLDRIQSQGCNSLIKRQIAKLVTDPEDIIRDFGLRDNVQSIVMNQQSEVIDSKYKKLLEIISKDKLTTEDLAIGLNADVSSLSIELTELELEGILTTDDQQRWVRIN